MAEQWGNQTLSREEVFRQKQEQIVLKATEMFSAYGFRETSLAQIADALGVTKPALYYYYRDKHSLLYACMHEALTQSLLISDKVLAQTGRSSTERLRSLLEQYIVNIMEKNFQFMMFVDPSSLKETEREKILSMRDEIERRVRRLIEEGIETGEMKDGDVKMMGFALLGAVNWTAKWYSKRGTKSPEQAAHEIVDLSLSGICT